MLDVKYHKIFSARKSVWKDATRGIWKNEYGWGEWQNL